MIARFFSYILGAIVLSIVLVLALVLLLDLPPPGNGRERAAQPYLLELLKKTHGQGIDVTTLEPVAISDDLSVKFAIRHVAPQDDACIADQTIAILNDNDCLVIEMIAPLPRWLSRIEPVILPLVIGLLVSILAAFLLAKRFLQPVQVIADGLDQLAAGRFDQRVSGRLSRADRAFRKLGGLVDEASERLQRLNSERETLFHDISHEIRSPLARLQVALGIVRRSPARIDGLLPQLEADIERMDRLIDEILMLARIDRSGHQPMDFGPIDLLDILDPIIADANFEGAERSVTCRYEGIDGIHINGSTELIYRALENLIRNAMRHTEEGTEVVVTGREDGGSYSISVRDHGPGVAEDDLSRLTEPFYKASSHPRSGAGLGLAIALHAAQLHHGSITIANEPNGGLSVCLTLTKRVTG